MSAVTMYSTPWCGYCQRLKAQMDRAGIPFEVVDIEQDPEAEQFVMSVNKGNAVVPTIKLADGRTLTNPTIVELTAALA